MRFGGSGGQGVVLMGVILRLAANHDRRCVVQTESYGPEARGGYSRSDVIISDEPIDYPKLEQADLLRGPVASRRPTATSKSLRQGRRLHLRLRARSTTPPAFTGTTFGVPFTRLAKEETGRVQTTNVLDPGRGGGHHRRGLGGVHAQGGSWRRSPPALRSEQQGVGQGAVARPGAVAGRQARHQLLAS